MIVLVPLAAVVVLMLGGIYLAWRMFALRDARRLLAISERAVDGDLEGAKALATRWERGNRAGTPLGHLRLARAWSIVGDHDQALTALDSIQLPGGRAGRSIRRAASEQRFDALKALGEEERAQEILHHAIDEDPSAPWLLMASSTQPGASTKRSIHARGMLVIEAFKDYRFAEAAEMAEALVRRAARNPMARLALPLGYLFLGSAQLAAGRDSAAEASFQQFMKRSLNRDAAERRIMKARAEGLLMGGRFPEATLAYEALVADQGTPEAFARLAMCRIRQGDVEQAAHDLDRAEELGYDAEKARFLRAQILVDRGRSTEAVALAQEAADTVPSSDSQASYTLAYVLATAQHPDAEATLRRYIELNPNDPDLGPLLDRPAPDGRMWSEYLESPPRQDS